MGWLALEIFKEYLSIRYPIVGWREMVELEFESRKYFAIGCWDEYLRGIYSDCMQLPPIDKRVNHEIKAWRVG